jgi:hypothetical protein
MRVVPKTLTGDKGQPSQFLCNLPAVLSIARDILRREQYAHNHGVLSNEPPTGGYRKFNGNNTLAM